MNIKVIFLGLAVLTGLCITQSSFAKSIVQIENSNQSTVLNMQNMTCAICEITIKKALQGIEGVKTIEVDSDKKTASIIFNGQKTNIEALIKATTHAGYPATVQKLQ